jgi:hypothetical protein
MVEGNLAREVDQRELERRLERSGQLDFDQQYRRRKESEAEKLARQRSKAKAMVRPASAVPVAALALTAGVVVMLVMLVLCYVQMNTISQDIVSMKSEIEQLEVEQVSLLARYEQAFDTTTVKEAAEAAGMTSPTESQIYYIDLPGEDRAVSYSQKSGIVQGVMTFLGDRFYSVMEYFR